MNQQQTTDPKAHPAHAYLIAAGWKVETDLFGNPTAYYWLGRRITAEQARLEWERAAEVGEGYIVPF